MQEAFLREITTWLKRGVDGIVIKGFSDMLVDSPETRLAIIKGWRDLIDSYSADDFDRHILCIEKDSVDGLLPAVEDGVKVSMNTSTPLIDEMLQYVDLLEVPFSMNFDGQFSITYR